MNSKNQRDHEIRRESDRLLLLKEALTLAGRGVHEREKDAYDLLVTRIMAGDLPGATADIISLTAAFTPTTPHKPISPSVAKASQETKETNMDKEEEEWDTSDSEEDVVIPVPQPVSRPVIGEPITPSAEKTEALQEAKEKPAVTSSRYSMYHHPSRNSVASVIHALLDNLQKDRGIDIDKPRIKPG